MKNAWSLFTLAGLTLVLAALSCLRASSRNIAPDAVSRATIWNPYEGELSSLQDGKVPPDPEARAFIWKSKGTWVFEWKEALHLEKLRLYVGETSNDYRIYAYLGGHLDETIGLRDPAGARTAFIEEKTRLTNQWLDIPFAPGTLADNIQLQTLGPAVFYEVEIYVRTGEDTAVEGLDWGQVKAYVSGKRSLSERN